MRSMMKKFAAAGAVALLVGCAGPGGGMGGGAPAPEEIRTGVVEQTVGLVNGRITELETKRR